MEGGTRFNMWRWNAEGFSDQSNFQIELGLGFKRGESTSHPVHSGFSHSSSFSPQSSPLPITFLRKSGAFFLPVMSPYSLCRWNNNVRVRLGSKGMIYPLPYDQRSARDRAGKCGKGRPSRAFLLFHRSRCLVRTWARHGCAALRFVLIGMKKNRWERRREGTTCRIRTCFRR